MRGGFSFKWDSLDWPSAKLSRSVQLYMFDIFILVVVAIGCYILFAHDVGHYVAPSPLGIHVLERRSRYSSPAKRVRDFRRTVAHKRAQSLGTFADCEVSEDTSADCEVS